MHLWTESKVCFPENRFCSCSLRTQEDTKIALLPELLPHSGNSREEKRKEGICGLAESWVDSSCPQGGASLGTNDKYCDCLSPDIGSPWTALENAAFYKINIWASVQNQYFLSQNETFSLGPSQIIHKISALVSFILVAINSLIQKHLCSSSKNFSNLYCAVLSVFDPAMFCFKECKQRKCLTAGGRNQQNQQFKLLKLELIKYQKCFT